MADDPSEETPNEESELVMPFVVVQSNDGPYDDDAYTAGWEMGSIDAKLSTMPVEVDKATWIVRTANLPQLDLLAMRYGWTLNTTSVNEWPEWRCVTLGRLTD